MMTCSGKPVDKLLDAVRALGPLVETHREASERDRRLPDALAAALADAGLFRLWLPRGFGGPELSPLDFMRVVEAASALDGSVGWLVANGAGMSRIAGYLPEDVARDWFAETNAFVVSATGSIGSAEKVDGGYRVTGRWPFGSGAHHATWFMGLCAVAGTTTMTCCHFARRNVEIIDTWHVSGLRGTGSCDFAVRDVVVPESHAHPFVNPPPTQPGLLYRMPPQSLFPWSVAVVPLGIARAAIDFVVAIAQQKARGNGPLLRDREVVQAAIGRAEAQHRAGRALLIAAMSELMAAVEAGAPDTTGLRANLRLACAHAADCATAIVQAMGDVAGSSAIFEGNRLERCIRDVHAATRHVAMAPAVYVLGGRLALGLDAGTARF